jgi:hypothetical protein
MCEPIKAGIFQELENALSIPCSDWSITIILDSFTERSQRMKQWLQYIHDQAPLLAKKNLTALQYLQTLCGDQMSPAQAWSLSYLVPEIGALGYPPMTIAKLNRDTMHQPKRDFRNEWWTLSGQITSDKGSGFFMCHILRHTHIPPSLWDSHKDPKLYSDVQIVSSLILPGSHEILEDISPVIPESWEFITLSDQPFGIQYLTTTSLRSNQADTLFPLEVQCDIGHQYYITLKLDNTKPLYMMNNNGCLTCTNGIGMKKYTFPVVSGIGTIKQKEDIVGDIQFHGLFEHVWEAGIMPESTPANLALRGLMNIEKSLAPSPSSISMRDHWMYGHVHLNNNIQIAWYIYGQILPKHKYHPSLLAISLPNGVVHTVIQTPKKSEVWIVVHQLHPWKLEITQQNKFTLNLTELSVSAPADKYGFDVFSHRAVDIVGTWSQDQIQGFGFLQVTDNATYEQRATQILKTMFPEHIDFLAWARTANYFSTMPDANDIRNAWLLWFIPVIIVVVLLILIIYLIWTKQKVYTKPWIQKWQKFRQR